MSHPVNPYIAGSPLRSKVGFYGRRDVLDWIVRELNNPATNALVLFGQRRIGKTTLLLQIQRILPTDSLLPIYFDLQDQSTRLLSQVLADLADTIAEKANLETPAAENFDDRGEFFRSRFLPELYRKIGDKCRLVLLLDEFDVLEQIAERELPSEVAAKSLLPFLRRLMLEEPRTAFVFALGRRSEDLALDFTATFKGSLTKEVWVLERVEAEAVIRQGEANNTLKFSNEAVSRILDLTSGHPYLTQLLCQRLWERIYSDNPSPPYQVDISSIDEAIVDTLEAGQAALAWLWDGLNPYEKIYAAALAEIAYEGQIISEDKVIQVLSASANRLRTREVELAPRELVKRRVLIINKDGNYKFAVELLRRWIRQNKPLEVVKDELDRVDPLAEQLFRLGSAYFQRQIWDSAVRSFRESLDVNTRHFRARLLLGEALLEIGNVDESVIELERAYELDQVEARLPLARALVTQAQSREKAGDEDGALAACDKALQRFPEPVAFQLRSQIWTRRGDEALKNRDLETARNYYLRAENSDKAGVVEQFINSQFNVSPKNKINYIYSHLVIEHTPPNEYRVGWYQADQVVQSTEKAHSDLQFTIDDWRDQPRDCGRTAFDHYLPGKTQKFISTYQNWAIQISTDLADVPWELLHDGQDFLCLSRPVGRKIQLLKEPEKHNYARSSPLRGLVIGNPTGNLPGAQDEAQAVAEILEKANIKVDLLNGPQQARAKAFSIKLSNNKYDFIHYAGHGHFNPDAPHLSGLKFQDATINAGELERGLKSRAFVFLSACDVAQTKTHESTFGFRGKFIEGLAISVLLGGAIGCLGPLWPISDGLAKEFALAFYKHLLTKKEPIGEAVRLARLELRDRAPDFWASWILYGDPLQTLT